MAYTRRRYTRRYYRRRPRTYRRIGRYGRRSRVSVFKRRAELSGTDLSRQTFHIRMVKTVAIPVNQLNSTVSIAGVEPTETNRQGTFSVLESLYNDE